MQRWTGFMIGPHRTFPVLALLLCLSARLGAQVPAAKPESAAVAEARALEARLPAPKLSPKASFELSPERQARLKKYLPDTLRQLSQRETLHLLVLGGAEVLELWSEDQKLPVMQTFPAAFARELAAQFFFTGGVRDAADEGLNSVLSPGITLRTLARAGGTVLDAAPILASTARQSPVDLVMICYGQAEAASGMSPVTFVRAMRQAVAAAHEMGAEVMLCAPWLGMSAQAETSLGIACPLADALRELAEDEGVLFVDLSDLSRIFDLPPTDAKDEGLLFERVAGTYRGFFHEAAGGRFQPRASLHARLGSLIVRDMLDGPAPQPWALGDMTAAWQKDGAELELRFAAINGSKDRLDLTVLPLIAGGWKPVTAHPQVSLPADARQTLTFQYARQTVDAGPVQESEVRLPVLIIAGKQVRVETLRAPVQPVTIVWALETLFNQESRFTAVCQIVNHSRSDTRGIWEAELLGRTLRGKFDLKPGATQPLDLSFDLNADAPPTQTAALKLTVKGDGLQLSSTRQTTLTRNLGLNAAVPLTGDKGAKGDVTLRAQADAKRLTLTCELRGPGLLLDVNTPGTAAWQIEANMDARSYGKRLEPGSTSAVRATGGAVPGKGVVHELTAWAFGTGYAAGFSPQQFDAELSSAGPDSHQITLILPRTYLYLHEWALGNGNSQLGINVRLTLNTAEGYRTWTLSPTTKPAEDVESLSILELTDKPTQRVTVDVH